MARLRPKTVKFHPSSVLPSDVLKWLEEMEEICTSSIECIQRGMDRSVLVTFRDEETANFVADLDTVQASNNGGPNPNVGEGVLFALRSY